MLFKSFEMWRFLNKRHLSPSRIDQTYNNKVKKYNIVLQLMKAMLRAYLIIIRYANTCKSRVQHLFIKI